MNIVSSDPRPPVTEGNDVQAVSQTPIYGPIYDVWPEPRAGRLVERCRRSARRAVWLCWTAGLMAVLTSPLMVLLLMVWWLM